MGYDEDRATVHTDMEAAAKASKDATETKIEDSKANRTPDYDDDAQNIGRGVGLTGSAMVVQPRDTTEVAFAPPRHTGADWQTETPQLAARASKKAESSS